MLPSLSMMTKEVVSVANSGFPSTVDTFAMLMLFLPFSPALPSYFQGSPAGTSMTALVVSMSLRRSSAYAFDINPL